MKFPVKRELQIQISLKFAISIRANFKLNFGLNLVDIFKRVSALKRPFKNSTNKHSYQAHPE
jgi:hypothetical protein